MVFVDLLAGTAAGVAISLVGHPFDTMKVLLQTSSRYSGMGDAARTIVAENGLFGFYQGVAAPLVGNGIYNAVQFAAYSRIRDMLTDNGANDSLNRVGIAAGITGAIVAGVEGPQDLFKSQMQAQMSQAQAAGGAPKYKGTGDCVRVVLKERGLMGVTQGLGATIARNTVGVSAYFYFYEAARRFQAGDKSVDTLAAWQVLAAGGIGGLGYWTLAYPLDIIKSAIQVSDLDPAKRKYKGFMQTATQLWAEGGVKRYTAGLTPCLIRSVPANAAGFYTYEVIKKAFDKKAE